MLGLSEFASFVAEKSGVKSINLIENDIMLHKILEEFHANSVFNDYLMKGGSCLIKCYFGYYRFSVDLDFTWRNQKTWEGLGESELRRRLLTEIREFASILKMASQELNLEFEVEPREKRFIEFGGGGRMATFKIWKGLELIKIQVNFVEKLLFPPKNVRAMTLLDSARISRDDRAYFKEILEFYKPISIMAYDEKEILCEKVRAILTRRAQKLRDFYDLFVLSKHGFKAEDLKKEILEKIRASLYYKKYRENLERNIRGLELDERLMEDPFERSLLITEPRKDFEEFLESIKITLPEIAKSI